ncbi:hypothetical protein BDZ88DRAFT_425017 [Geranomyces variabilis]|nr:hypothetical protein BDZ88DRAFT_425017 [Geranomyces variabilis]KAJ3141219.1 hypothetical protein HDU90_007245 [Geranomyces variabilis]
MTFAIEQLLRVAKPRKGAGSSEVVTELVAKGREAACQYIRSLYEEANGRPEPPPGLVAKRSFELLTHAQVIELSQRQEALSKTAAEIFTALNLTLQDLERYVPASAHPYIILQLNKPGTPASPHPGRNNMVLLNRYVVKLTIADNLLNEDLLVSVKPQVGFIEDALASLRTAVKQNPELDHFDHAVICQLSAEVAEYYFQLDDLPTARSHFRRAAKILKKHGEVIKSEPYCSVDPARVHNCILACCAEISVTSTDINAKELTEKAKALAVFTRCRKSGEYDAPALEGVFQWDLSLSQKLIPAELKKAIVREAYEKGFKESAARLGVYIGLSAEGNAEIMVNEVPALSVLAFKTLPNGDRLFKDLVNMLDQISLAVQASVLPGARKPDFHEHLVAFAELLCRRVDRREMWAAVSAKLSVSEKFQSDYQNRTREQTLEALLTARTPAPITMPDQVMQLRMSLLTVLSDEDINNLEKVNIGVSRPRLVKLLLEHVKHAHKQKDSVTAQKLLSHIIRICDTQAGLLTQDEITELSMLMSEPAVHNVEGDPELRANDKEAYFALAEASYAKKAYWKALCFYLDGLAVHSHNFAMTLLLDTDRQWLGTVMPRMGECAAMCQEYFLAAVLSQLHPTPDSSVPFALLDKALEAMVENETRMVAGEQRPDSQRDYIYLVEDRGYPDNVISTLWNLDLLEYAVAYFKKLGDVATVQLLVRVIGRPEASPAAHESYVSMVLSRYLRHCRERIASA